MVRSRSGWFVLATMTLSTFCWCNRAAEQTPAPVPEATPEVRIPVHLIRELEETFASATPRLTVRRRLGVHRSVLSQGTSLETTYPKAANLADVWAIMMRSAQELAIEEPSDEAAKTVVSIAGKLVTSNAPTVVRLQADLLVTHAKLNQTDGKEDGARQSFRAFVARYEGAEREVEAKALSHGALMAFDAGDKESLQRYLNKLSSSFGDVPGVAGFLRDRFGMYVNAGRLFKGRYTTLDGKTLVAPMDLLGRASVVYFWDPAVPDMERKLSDVKRLYQGRTDCRIVGISLDQDPGRVARFSKLHGLDWLQTVAPDGRGDSTYAQFGTPDLPCYAIVGPDGRVLSDDIGKATRLEHTGPWGAMLTFLMSGEWLITEPFGATDMARPPDEFLAGTRDSNGKQVVPLYLLDDIQSRFLIPPKRYIETTAESMARYETSLALCRRVAQDHPDATNLYLVWNRMSVAAEALAMLKADTAMRGTSREIAGRILASGVPQEAKLLADFIAVREALRAAPGPDAVKETIRALSARYEGTPARNVAAACAALLTQAVGEENLVSKQVEILRKDDNACEDWRVRHVLRCLGEQPDKGRPFEVELTRLDGTTLHLPRDVKGKITIVYFVRMCELVRGDQFANLRKQLWLLKMFHDQNKGDVEIVFIPLDNDRATLQELVDKEGLGWEIAFSGAGWDDATAQKYSPSWEANRRWPFLCAMLLDGEGRVVHDLRPKLNPARNGELGPMPWPLDQPYAPSMLKQLQTQRGLHAFESGRYEEAEKYLARVVARRVEHGELAALYWPLAQARLKQKKWSAALSDLDKLVKNENPTEQSCPMLVAKAEALEGLGRQEEAQAIRVKVRQFEAATEEHRK